MQKLLYLHDWSKKLVTFGFIILEMLNRFGVQDFGHNVHKKVSAEQFSASNLPVSNIFIKYRKHCKSYFSFQLSGQIGLIWAVRNYTPSWKQYPHERHITIFRLTFKILPKSEKVGLSWFPVLDTNLWWSNIKHF